MRWWMVGLITAGSIINDLARNTGSVVAPTAHCCCATAS
jgi:ACS family hexuronate transporter-like MFS transporter